MKKLKLNKEIIQERIDKKGLNIKIIGDFLGIHEKTLFKCFDCGHEFLCTPNNLVKTGKSQKCPNYAKNKYGDYHRLTVDVLNKKLKNINNTFEVYNKNIKIKNQNDIIEFKCTECGHVHQYSVHYIIRNKVLCQSCQSKYNSKGENIIEQILIKNKIMYKHDSMIEKIDGRNLRFDFIIYDDNNNIKFIIEFDGKQHFSDGFTFGRKDVNKYNSQYYKKTDKLKDEYAKSNGIPLVRIRYNQINSIEQILKMRNII